MLNVRALVTAGAIAGTLAACLMASAQAPSSSAGLPPLTVATATR